MPGDLARAPFRKARRIEAHPPAKAAYSELEGAVGLLTERGADVSVADDAGLTALDYARS